MLLIFVLILDVITTLNGIAMIERGMQSYPSLQESVLAFSAGWDTCFFLACIYIILITNYCFRLYIQIIMCYRFYFRSSIEDTWHGIGTLFFIWLEFIRFCCDFWWFNCCNITTSIPRFCLSCRV